MVDHGIKVTYTGNLLPEISNRLSAEFHLNHCADLDHLEQYLNEQSLLSLPDCIIIEVDASELAFSYTEKLKSNPLFQGIILILVAPQKNDAWRTRAIRLKVHDYYTWPFPVEDLCERIHFLVKFKLIVPNLSELSAHVDVTYKVPISKRLFDVISSGAALLVLSPLLLIVALIIRLESKGPVIYKSKRVGTGYKIFDFYKFRSMRSDADKMLSQLSNLNQYTDTEATNGKSAFVKIKNDPRITRFGHFIRKTSIDELPQLFNVLIGDMSLVGNRPLPLYEAEMLTSNEWSQRFLGPAGLTGLWQISKRGKEEMSERERKKLDNFYASNYSFWLDMKIIAGTIPALLQKEKV
ncbi:sugar transferase [Pedobacter sp. BS3]|nr:sugar transferase [Pedobacter sp. BS3]